MMMKSGINRLAAGAVAVLSALAIAAPVAEAATWPVGVVGPLISYAKGPTVVGDTFNGGTTVCVSTAASACSTNFAP
jgi:hypothetical protein